MTRDPVLLGAYAALSLWTSATIIVGLLVHFGRGGEQYQPWIVPMCLITGIASFLVDRLKKARGCS